MECLFYLSKTNVPFGMDDLYRLSESSARLNAAAGVTGYLYHYDGYFMQYLEARLCVDLDRVFATIRRDPRHRLVTSLRRTSPYMLFPNWHMRWMEQSDKSQLSIDLEKILLLYAKHLSAIESVTPEKETVYLSYNDWSHRIWRVIEKLAAARAPLSEPEAAIL